MLEVFVGLGSNIDAEPNLRWALGKLAGHFGACRHSSVYRSPAFGFDGPDFLNMVVGFSVDSDADAVEAVLSELENQRGRKRTDRSGSRTLDLDLLLFGERVDPQRRLPRIDILEYPFVLAPLSEIAPGTRHPVTGISIRDAWMARSEDMKTLKLLGRLDAA